VIESATQLSRWYLNQQLDGALGVREAGRRHENRQRGCRVAGQLQLESAVLFEQVTNALAVGEQFLARVCRLASQHFRLASGTAIAASSTLDSIYAKTDRAATGAWGPRVDHPVCAVDHPQPE
jgi:hypothetical protein